jgi:tRNA(fMet)-specific endonuclease VapC
MKVLQLDTNAASMLFKPYHTLFESCLAAVADHQWYISFMTRSELLLWPRLNRWGARRQELLSQHIGLCTTLLPDEETCEIWAETTAKSKSLGRPMTVNDAWIAATAIQWDMPLVTADFRDFEHLKNLALVPIR